MWTELSNTIWHIPSFMHLYFDVWSIAYRLIHSLTVSVILYKDAKQMTNKSAKCGASITLQQPSDRTSTTILRTLFPTWTPNVHHVVWIRFYVKVHWCPTATLCFAQRQRQRRQGPAKVLYFPKPPLGEQLQWHLAVISWSMISLQIRQVAITNSRWKANHRSVDLVGSLSRKLGINVLNSLLWLACKDTLNCQDEDSAKDADWHPAQCQQRRMWLVSRCVKFRLTWLTQVWQLSNWTALLRWYMFCLGPCLTDHYELQDIHHLPSIYMKWWLQLPPLQQCTKAEQLTVFEVVGLLNFLTFPSSP